MARDPDKDLRDQHETWIDLDRLGLGICTQVTSISFHVLRQGLRGRGRMLSWTEEMSFCNFVHGNWCKLAEVAAPPSKVEAMQIFDGFQKLSSLLLLGSLETWPLSWIFCNLVANLQIEGNRQFNVQQDIAAGFSFHLPGCGSSLQAPGLNTCQREVVFYKSFCSGLSGSMNTTQASERLRALCNRSWGTCWACSLLLPVLLMANAFFWRVTWIVMQCQAQHAFWNKLNSPFWDFFGVNPDRTPGDRTGHCS